MEFKFYGVRGSCPTPITKEEYHSKVIDIINHGKSMIRERGMEIGSEEIYQSLPSELRQNIGGNTTCLYLKSDEGKHFIFDMGTGIRVLGNDLAPLAFGGDKLKLNILMTHTHWDHIQGWPFFKPAYSPNTEIAFHSCIQNLKERLDRQQNEENFPISFDMMPSRKSFALLEEDREVTIDGLKITPFFLKHPGSCTGYKIEKDDKSLIFATDVEFHKNELHILNEWKQKLGKTDVLIIDAQYSSEEADNKVGWGHTSVKMAVEVAERIGVSEVYLTHFEPDHTDIKVNDIVHEEISDSKHKVKVIQAREGLSVRL